MIVLPKTYIPIATTTLTSDQASVDFTAISSSYTDIVIIGSGQQSANDSNWIVLVGNGSIDTGNNYSSTRVLGDGSSAQSDRTSNYGGMAIGAVKANIQGSFIAHLQNYSNTTTNKTCLGRTNDSSGYVFASVSLWRSTSAINQIRIKSQSGNIKSGTVLTLYGIAAA